MNNLDQPLIARDALTLENYDDFHPLEKYCVEHKFQFSEFLNSMMTLINRCLISIKEKLPTRIQFPEIKDLCATCKIEQDNLQQPFMHCKNCLHPVTHTKVGPCIVLKWKNDDSSEEEIVTIDLVPIFPVKVIYSIILNPDSKCNNEELADVQYAQNINEVFNVVTRTLMERKPPNWFSHLKGIIKSDRILPESFQETQNEKAKDDVFEVGLKLLHYGSENNYVIRPAQMLRVVDFSGYPTLCKEVYCIMKYLKTVLKVDVKSYFLKKVVLRKEIVQMAEKSKRVEKPLFEAMTYPAVKKVFESKVDYKQWKKNMDKAKVRTNVIPLLKQPYKRERSVENERHFNTKKART